MRKPTEWTDRELIEGLCFVEAWNQRFYKLNKAWIVSQLALRRISERIEQAIIDGMTVCFDEQGELIAVEIDNG